MNDVSLYRIIEWWRPYGSKLSEVPLTFFRYGLFINKKMKEIKITERQLNSLVTKLSEEKNEGSYMSKQQLFTIAVLAYKMWEEMDDNEQLEDWMESKIAQSEQSISSVVNSFLYNEMTDDNSNNPDKLDLGDLIIGN